MDVDEAPAAPAAASTSAAPTGAASSSSSSVLAPSATAVASVTVSLHPLVIMNVSEHWTRTRAQNGGQAQQVYGALIGQQSGRNIEIMNSFELNVLQPADPNDPVIIDRDYYALKESQFKQVFSDMDFLGWYSTAANNEQPCQKNILVHQQICDIHESPLFLQLSPGARHTDLPVALYESLIDLQPAAESADPADPAAAPSARMLFVKLNYTLATEDSERIGLDHVAKISGSGGGADENSSQSRVAEHVMVQHSAIKMLASRIRLILDYVKAVEAGELPHNHEIMREAKALSDRLPVLESRMFKPEFYTQYNDGALLAYLGTIMKSCNHLNQFTNKFNVLHQRQGSGRRMRGLFF